MATPKFYVKASSYSNINPYPTWKRDADYWEKDLSNNLFYMSGNIGIGYPIPAGGLVVTTTIGIGTSAPQAALDVSGNVYLRDGTVTAPIFTFSADTNTGFYRPGNDTLGFVTGGSERMRIDASGNMGIGTITPRAKFDVSGDVIISGRTLLTGGYDERNVGESYPSTRLKWKSMTAAGLGGNTAILGLDDISGTGLVVYDYQGGGNLWKIERPTGNMFVNGYVGIGTITPRAKLDINDTGAIVIPVGTTAQLPNIPALGMLRFNIDIGRLQFYNQNGWTSIGNVSATGGNTTIDFNGYRIHTFTSSGNLTVVGGGLVEYLVVAGGGGGGRGEGNTGGDGAGGGGAGGLLQGQTMISAQSYTITVGAGGAGTTTTTQTGANGADTVFANILTIGGGGGGSDGNSGTGATGGSGGGAGAVYQTNTFGGSMTAGQGNVGGNSPSAVNYYRSGGGGGGAGSAGQTVSSFNGGNGGNGITSAISGVSLTYSGGGGGGTSGNQGVAGVGGTGGGGTGGNKNTSVPSAGQTNRGGGGGGGSGYGTSSDSNIYSNGANGGSGIVIIRYLL